jgi:hypothetical protein
MWSTSWTSDFRHLSRFIRSIVSVSYELVCRFGGRPSFFQKIPSRPGWYHQPFLWLPRPFSGCGPLEQNQTIRQAWYVSCLHPCSHPDPGPHIVSYCNHKKSALDRNPKTLKRELYLALCLTWWKCSTMLSISDLPNQWGSRKTITWFPEDFKREMYFVQQKYADPLVIRRWEKLFSQPLGNSGFPLSSVTRAACSSWFANEVKLRDKNIRNLWDLPAGTEPKVVGYLVRNGYIELWSVWSPWR